MLQNKKLLITGGTGSFGTAFLKKAVANNEFSEIRIFSRDEKKQDDLRKSLKDPRVKFYIGDVRDANASHHTAVCLPENFLENLIAMVA